MASKLPWLLLGAGVLGLAVGMAGKEEPEEDGEPKGYEYVEEGIIEVQPEAPGEGEALPSVEFKYRIGRAVVPGALYDGQLMVQGQWEDVASLDDIDVVRQTLRSRAESLVAGPGITPGEAMPEPEYARDSIYENYRYRIYIAKRTAGRPLYEGEIWVNGAWEPRFDTRSGEVLGGPERLTATERKTKNVIDSFVASPGDFSPEGAPPLPNDRATGFAHPEAPDDEGNGGGQGLGS